MAIHYYIVPKIGTGTSPIDPFRPKYVDQGALGAGWNPGAWLGMPYGAENLYILRLDLSAADDATLSAQTDVIAIPPLTNTVGAALTTVKNKLEAVNLPSDWVTSGMTYQQVLGTVMRIIQFMQRYNGQNFNKLFSLTDKNSNPITLDTTFGNLTAGQKTKLQAVGTSFNIDTSGFTNASTLRQILKGAADQLFPNNSLIMGADNF